MLPLSSQPRLASLVKKGRETQSFQHDWDRKGSMQD